MIKACVYCNGEFETKTAIKKFCSPSCKTMNYRKRKNKDLPNKVCKGCSKDFHPKWGEQQECCSKSCQSIYVNNKPEVVAKKFTGVVKSCDHCKKEYKVKKSKAERSKYCSKGCHNTGQKGKYRTPSHICPQCKKEFRATKKRDICCSKTCQGLYKGYKSNKGKTPWKGRKHTEETKNKMSKLMTERILAGGGSVHKVNSGHYKRGTHTSPKSGGPIKYDSSYELQAYKILDGLSKVQTYSRCNFYIEYEHDGKIRRYIPDILITYTDSTQDIIEVKPESMLDEEVNLAKFAAAQKYCKKNTFGFDIWSEGKLF